MTQKFLAKIREMDCIGCTKCIDACPPDAILGSEYQMHTVIASECIGCKLCLLPCPVDCIELVHVPESHTRIPPEHVKYRHSMRKMRLETQNNIITILPLQERKQYIANAVLRVKNRKTTGQSSS